MSIGVNGAIGEEWVADFALSRAFRVSSETNRGTANCKICDLSVKKGEGHAVLVPNMRIGMPNSFSPAYLCGPCFGKVSAALARIRKHPNARPDFA